MPAIVLGGTGYVAGELLRLIAAHPHLGLKGILSDSQPGAAVAAAFPQLRSAYPDLAFASLDEIEALVARTPHSAIFSAAPHGVAAAIIDRLLSAAEAGGMRTACASTSRRTFATRAPAPMNRSIGMPHAAPARIASIHLRGARSIWPPRRRRMSVPSGLLCYRCTCSRACRCWRWD